MEYFLDEMQQCELNMIINYIQYLDRNAKEADRANKYISIQSNSKNKIDIMKMFPLPWDNEWKNNGTKVTKEEAEKYKARAKQLEEMIKNVKGFEQVDMKTETKYTYNNPNG